MTFIGYLICESGRILLKKGYKNHSDLIRGVSLYKITPPNIKKSLIKCLREVIMLYNYWNAFPDTYFRMGMFAKSYKDYDRMKSFVPQGAYAKLSMDKHSEYHLLIDDKILFHDIMTQYGLPVPTRFFTFRGGEFRHGQELLTDAEVDTIIRGISDDRIFVKKFTGGAASGVSVFTKKENGVYVDKDGDIVSASMIRKKFSNQDFFFEKQIIQEPVLSQFNPDTVNTIRVLTYNNKIVSATVRFGGKGEYVDNVSANGVAVSLDIETGILGDYGMKMYSTIEHFYEHPDSHIPFKGTKVTQWSEVRSVVERTLKYLPYYKSVGFDVATTKEGPVILEINTGAGINLSQMGKEKGLRDKFI